MSFMLFLSSPLHFPFLHPSQNFYHKIEKKELYVRYIYKLAELHKKAQSYTEAGFTLLLHAKSLEVQRKGGRGEGGREKGGKRELGREVGREKQRDSKTRMRYVYRREGRQIDTDEDSLRQRQIERDKIHMYLYIVRDKD